MRCGFTSGGEWTIVCPESNEPHELRVPKHPFSPARGVTCEKWHLFVWAEARDLAIAAARRIGKGEESGGGLDRPSDV